MMSRRETEELIERYCTGQLSPEELRIFEQWRESDPELAKAIDEHRLVVDAFRVYAEQSALRNRLKLIQEEIETEQYRFQSPLRVVQEKPSPVWWKKYKLPAVAAAVAVITVCMTLLTFNLTGVTGNKQQSAYQELRREVESIKRRQKDIIQGISQKQDGQNPADAERTFTGSGFALNKNGYVLTSFHVVADARKVYISNARYEQLRMKVVYTNPALDMAVLKVDEEKFEGFTDIPYTFRRSVADPGEKVYTLGYPREDMVFGEGAVSSYTGFDGDTSAYEISIPVNPGNSGGPLFDHQGNLIGIVSGRNNSAEGASFAVKAKWISEDLKAYSGEKISLPTGKTLKGADRSAQVKKLKDHVFMVKVTN